MFTARRRHTLAFLICVCLIVPALLPRQTQSQQVGRRTTTRQTRPRVRLVVGLMIDQFRQDYLERFRDQFVPGGFNRLLGGAVFANAHYSHTPTFTACGHATFMGGSTPSLNGIIGNEWFDREMGRRVTSVSDTKVNMLGTQAAAQGASPWRLVGSTLGDEMRLANNGQSKVIGIAFKDRSAILPAGKRPTAAYWFDNRGGSFVSSTYYFPALPEWAQKFNREVRPDRYFGRKWDRLLAPEAYSRSRPDDSPEEKSSYGTTFPYTITGGETAPGARFYSQFELTPFANEYTFEFVKAAIENEGLGADAVPDLLTISLSPNDLLGHTYGPYSQEVHDMTLRTDRLLAEFFDYLDRRIGLNNILIAFSADHGVAPIPEMVKAMGWGGRIGAREVPNAIGQALTSQLGDGRWVRDSVNGNVYLDESVIDTKKLDRKDVERRACAAALTVAGIGSCFTHSDLAEGTLPNGPIAQSVARGFYPSRNGNLVLVPEAFWFVAEGISTTHGSPYSYDTHVPVILAGPGLVEGRYLSPASPADIAPTLAALLNLTPPSNVSGRILVEAVAKQTLR